MHRLTHWPVDVFQTVLPGRAAVSRRPALQFEQQTSASSAKAPPLCGADRLVLMNAFGRSAAARVRITS